MSINRGREVEQIAGRDLLPPHIHDALQRAFNKLSQNNAAHGHEISLLNARHKEDKQGLRDNLQSFHRENKALRANLYSAGRENKSLQEKLDSDGLHALYLAGTKVIEKQAAQIKELRAKVLQQKEELEKLEITSTLRNREKDRVIAEYQDVQVIAKLKAQNAELASTSKAHKMLNDELEKKVMVVQKHFNDRKVVMEDQEKLIKRYQKQLEDTEKAQGN